MKTVNRRSFFSVTAARWRWRDLPAQESEQDFCAIAAWCAAFRAPLAHLVHKSSSGRDRDHHRQEPRSRPRYQDGAVDDNRGRT